MQQMLPERPHPPPIYSSHPQPQLPENVQHLTPSLDSHHELPPIASSQHETSLPSVQSLLAEAPPPRRSSEKDVSVPWPSSNPLSPYHLPSYSSPGIRPTYVMESPAAMEIDGLTLSSRRGGSVVTIDDPDVRLAAEALGDLRAADFHAPQLQHPVTTQSQTEPLLSLLTTSYPRSLGPIIDASLSTYSASKNYSPVFRTSAEAVERGLTPVVNRAGTIGRVTGVESIARWALRGRRPSHHRQVSDQETGPVSNKRRKTRPGEDDDIEAQEQYMGDMAPVYRQFHSPRERRPSNLSTVDSLPAYDDFRSPSYTQNDQSLVIRRSRSPSSSWQSRLILSTSGLSVAMSEESLRSLKYCLSWLRWANERLGKVVEALQNIVLEYDGARRDAPHNEEHDTEAQGQIQPDHEDLQRRVESLKSHFTTVMKDAMDVVTTYASGGLPENAKNLIRHHFVNFPSRAQYVLASTTATSKSAEPETKDTKEKTKVHTKKVIVVAKESLGMVGQIIDVLDGTIVSAEDWCERLGKKKRAEFEEVEAAGAALDGAVTADEEMAIGVNGNGDVKSA